MTMKQHPNTKKHMRRQLIDWKRSVKKTQKQCYVSNKTTNLEVHHLSKPFSEMFKDAHNKLGIQYHKDTKDYTESELKALTDEVVNMHKDVTALVLESSIHRTLHDIYGLNFTMNDVEEFKAVYTNNKGEDVHGKKL